MTADGEQLTKKVTKTCYMCPSTATTKEHVPPRSFFIPPYHKNLVWVPSCEHHNTANSLDVEYVRTIVPTSIQTNDVARELGEGKIMRTLERSPKLYQRIYKDAEPLIVDGFETAAHGVEFNRLRKVMEAIAFGMHFHHFGRRYFGRWWFYSPSLMALKAVKKGKDDGQGVVRNAFARLPITEIDTVHPQVFKFGLHAESILQVMFRFTFYGGFIVYARGVPAYKKFRIPRGAF